MWVSTIRSASKSAIAHATSDSRGGNGPDRRTCRPRQRTDPRHVPPRSRRGSTGCLRSRRTPSHPVRCSRPVEELRTRAPPAIRAPWPHRAWPVFRPGPVRPPRRGNAVHPARAREQHLHRRSEPISGAGRARQHQRRRPSGELSAQNQERQSSEVVAVQMRDHDCVDRIRVDPLGLQGNQAGGAAVHQQRLPGRSKLNAGLPPPSAPEGVTTAHELAPARHHRGPRHDIRRHRSTTGRLLALIVR